MKTKHIIFYGPLAFLIFGCTTLERSSSSGYSLGQHAKSEVKTPKKTSDNQRLYLSQLENSIPTKEEIAQYSKMLPYFQGDSEKIEYLSLPNFEEKQKWARDHHLSDRANQTKSDYQDSLEAQDIALGMPIDLVKQSWGEPELVEVSGNPQFRNERWHYHKMISTPSGYKSEKRVVYFEGGKVAGWEVH